MLMISADMVIATKPCEAYPADRIRALLPETLPVHELLTLVSGEWWNVNRTDRLWVTARLLWKFSTPEVIAKLTHTVCKFMVDKIESASGMNHKYDVRYLAVWEDVRYDVSDVSLDNPTEVSKWLLTISQSMNMFFLYTRAVVVLSTSTRMAVDDVQDELYTVIIDYLKEIQ